MVTGENTKKNGSGFRVVNRVETKTFDFPFRKNLDCVFLLNWAGGNTANFRKNK
jgi:hypothetical protein